MLSTRYKMSLILHIISLRDFARIDRKVQLIFYFQRQMNSSLSCEKNEGKNINISETDIWEFSMSHRKMKKCKQNNTWQLFNIDSFSSFSPSLSLSASLRAWKHLNTKFSELFWHGSLCVMTSDSSGDKLKSMSVSAWVFTNLLSGTAFQFWKHYYMQVAMNNRM